MIRTRFIAVALVAALASPAAALGTSAGEVTITPMATGLEEPWSVAFLPDGGFLVTERDGRLTRFGTDGTAARIEGVPDVFAEGQGGLFDVLVPRDFGERSEILLSFARPDGQGGGGTAVAAARLEGDRLTNLRLLFTMNVMSASGRHFGGRIVEAADGAVFLTIGDRGMGMPAQDPDSHIGKVIRLTRDGGAAIWSSGHRNPQGATLDADGRLWTSEHGAQGGDEINRPEQGKNYGWPVITYGKDYDDSPIGEGTGKPGLEQPLHYWDPSIAPSGHVIYSGRLWPDWQGDHFVGSLKFSYIARMDPDASGPGGWAEERIEAPETGRVRDVREAPDGSIWFISVVEGAVFRMAPAATE